jgi:hypothetical protein
MEIAREDPSSVPRRAGGEILSRSRPGFKKAGAVGARTALRVSLVTPLKGRSGFGAHPGDVTEDS